MGPRGEGRCEVPLRAGSEDAEEVTLPCSNKGFQRLRISELQLGDAEFFAGLQIAFAVEPVGHLFDEQVDWDTVAGFEEAVGDGERVVEDGVVGEVAHGEAIEVTDWARVSVA